MPLSSKERQARSKLRQALGLKLNVWAQRVKDMEIALALGKPEAAKKMDFSRQEHAKAQQALRELDKGFRMQRVWVNDKPGY